MNIATLDLNLLRVLDALLREGSTTAAGLHLGLSQPAVSAALRRLRHALNDPLFVRSGNGLEPTPRALDLELPLRRILDDLEALLADSAFDPSTARQIFKLSGSDFFAEMLMPDLGDYCERNAPGIRMQLVDLVPDNYVETLRRYEVDLALIPRMKFPEWADHEFVFVSSFSVIARTDHPAVQAAGLRPGDIMDYDLFCALQHVLFSPEGKLQAMGDAALAAVGRKRTVAMTMPVFSGVVSAVQASDRIALLPTQLAEQVAETRGLDLFRPPMPIDPAEIVMVWHRRSTGDRAHRWLRQTIRSILASLNESGQGYRQI